MGTSYYIAPEAIRMEYSPECDMWSIGVILYLMLAGIPPFNGKDDSEILAKVTQGKYSMDTLLDLGVSESARDFISKLLEIDPKKRLTSTTAKFHPWI